LFEREKKSKTLPTFDENCQEVNSELEGVKVLYKNIKFTDEVHKYFVDKYYNDDEFSDSPEFLFVNTLFRFFKLISIEIECKSEEAALIMEKKREVDDKDMLKVYYSNKKRKENKKVDIEEDKKLQLIDENLFENYFVIDFFEQITESVYIQLEDKKITRVIFTKNPKIAYLSNNTKNYFLDNVNRETRYLKLFSLIESSEYFFDEIKYNFNRSKNEKLFKYFSQISYFKVCLVLYLILVLINLTMIIVFEKLEDTIYFMKYVYILATVNFIVNVLFSAIWFYTKQPLYYLIENNKYLIRNNLPKDKKPSLLQSIVVFYNSLVISQDVIIIFLNVIVGMCIWFSHKNIFLFGIQLLFITNLSSSFENITRSVQLRWKQFLATFITLISICYTYSAIAFFTMNEQYIKSGNNPRESLTNPLDYKCQTLFYCFLTTIYQGLRIHGGIGDFLNKISFHRNREAYMNRFWFDESFYLIVIVFMMKIAFGIIIDTFRELRIHKQKQEFDKMQVCFICCAERDDLEQDCINFENHRIQEHNAWNYVYYIIGLKFMDVQDMNAINSYVMGKIENKNISWFPTHSKKED